MSFHTLHRRMTKDKTYTQTKRTIFSEPIYPNYTKHSIQNAMIRCIGNMYIMTVGCINLISQSYSTFCVWNGERLIKITMDNGISIT